MKTTTYVTKATLPPFEEYIEEIRDIWDTHWLTNMGAKHNELEKLLCERLDVSNISLFCNGHMALELVIQAFGLTGEVITTPFTFASTTHAIVRNGLTPVFCDINPNNYTIDVTKIESLITDKTSAIIPVHVYGNICDVEEIDRIAKKHNLKVIYDAAHAFGVEYKGKGIGNYGDASMFSFHATKVFNTIEGGAITYRDETIGKKLYMLKNFGIKNEEEVVDVGANAKMNEFSAVMGICNLRHLNREIDKRRRVTEIYNERLKSISGITIPIIQNNIRPNYAYYPIIVDSIRYGMSRDALYDILAKEGIYVRKYFFPLISDFGCYKGKFTSDKTPMAQRMADSVLTLPLYGDIEDDIVHKICDIIGDTNIVR
ncbi:MAG: DegT/DnrJ/EryC1/StrS family aminotransferase [Lachnospiraceae bacterium]|nr:DegT/DnrJ/EryC1/StrS family aminotransferase [Lachnospiraceae bacterium]